MRGLQVRVQPGLHSEFQTDPPRLHRKTLSHAHRRGEGLPRGLVGKGVCCTSLAMRIHQNPYDGKRTDSSKSPLTATSTPWHVCPRIHIMYVRAQLSGCLKPYTNVPSVPTSGVVFSFVSAISFFQHLGTFLAATETEDIHLHSKNSVQTPKMETRISKPCT